MINSRKKQKGFTLVELLIVVAIIAVLAAVVTPVALNAINDSKATAVYAEIKSIETAYLTATVSGRDLALNNLEISGLATSGNSKNAAYVLAGNKLTVTVDSNITTKLNTLLTESPAGELEVVVTP